MTIKLSEHAGGGNVSVYSPALLTNENVAWQEGTASMAGATGITFVGLLRPNFNRIIQLRETINTATAPLEIYISGNKLAVRVNSNTNTNICLVYSTIELTDGELYAFKFEYKAATGTVSFLINGEDVDDLTYSGRLVTTGTMTTDTVTLHYMQSYNHTNLYNGSIGFSGLSFKTGYEWDNFFDSNNQPIKVDETTWAAWNNEQPAAWNEFGDWKDNRGFGTDCSQTGATGIEDPDGTYAGLGLPTIGDAVAADIAADKIAWVDGVRLVGESEITPAILAHNHPNLIAFYTGNNWVGTTIVDQTGQNHATAIGGLGTLSGKFGVAFNFGVNRYIDVGEAVYTLTGSQVKTYCAWVYNAVTTDLGAACIFAAGSTGNNHMINMRVTGCQIEGNGSQSSVIASPGYVADTTWQFLAWEVDMGAQTMSAYLNGVLVSGPTAFPADNTSLVPTNYGAVGSYINYYTYQGEFTGKLDHIRIFDRGLTDAEHLELAAEI